MLKFLLAQASVEDKEAIIKGIVQSGKPVLSREVGFVLIAAGVVCAVLLLWAFFVRKRPKELHGSRVIAEPNRKSERIGSSGRRRHRKRRPAHPDNLGRNPTLAETGGLPPLRSDEPPSPTAANQPPQGFSPPV
jgi:hypothetical protein